MNTGESGELAVIFVRDCDIRAASAVAIYAVFQCGALHHIMNDGAPGLGNTPERSRGHIPKT